jgi:hypothetical protein
MPRVWQIAAGERCRDYRNLFLDHDVMFMGPGRYGNYNNSTEIYKKAHAHQVHSFVKNVKNGDIVLLRFGYNIEAIGIVADDNYLWEDTFDDVFGWDLQHTRRVVWQNHLDESLKQIQGKKEKELFADRKQIPTFTAVKDRIVLDRIEHLFEQCKTRPLKAMPTKLPKPLELEQLGEKLFAKGLPNESVDKVLLAIQRQRRLANWYEEDGERSKRPTEHEAVAHMILPFLLALGWSEQLLAVEWHKIDLAAFRDTPTTEENCCLLFEAKRLGHGLQNIFDQATDYVEKCKLNDCKKIVLTDGIRLYLYQRQTNGKWNDKPVGYLNIKSIRINHIAPAGTNAVKTIMELTPAGINRV